MPDHPITEATAAGHFIHQDWPAYTKGQHQTWATLVGRRMPALRRTASQVFLDRAATTPEETEPMAQLFDRRPFKLQQILDQSFRIDDLQPVLCVVDGFGQLFEAIPTLEPNSQ